ncbi:hypothetical protein ONZ45_g3801 [Pleurotus djamor]|nr:hypothetical protein ONZ45_g3801 [Pleurotus djamor]
MAMVKLGIDEDDFLLTLRREYGSLVYIPWPMKQIFVLEGSYIQKVYATPSSTLAFTPIRRSLQLTAFGSIESIAQGEGLARMFPVHAKGLTNLRLDAPVARFAHIVQSKVFELKERVESTPNHSIEINIVRWIIDVMFEAGTSALFGEEFCERAVKAGLQESFNAFDASFPLLASEMIPLPMYKFVPPVAKGMQGREEIWKLLKTWIEDGMPGLDEGVVREMAEMGLAEGYSSYETAKLLMGDLWALQANAPFAATALVLYVLQSTLLPRVIQEFDAIPTNDVNMKALASMPLAASCVQETVRLNTSSFSIRLVQKDFVLSLSEDDPGFLIPCDGTRVVCITRTAHLTEQIWGESPDSWVGDRFLAQNGEDTISAKRSREMNGFGGGISACEGRHLATAELKTILFLLLSHLEVTPLQHVADPKIPVKANASGIWKGLQPSRDPTRPGLGAFQFGTSDVRVKITTRCR